MVAFERPLPVPRPLGPSTVDADGRRVFDLTAAAGRHDFGGRTAPTYGLDGGNLGRRCAFRRSAHVVIGVYNGPDEATRVHRTACRCRRRWTAACTSRSRPERPGRPVGRSTSPQPPLWYHHPHPHGDTARHVYRGLVGMFIVDDPDTDAARPAAPVRGGTTCRSSRRTRCSTTAPQSSAAPASAATRSSSTEPLGHYLDVRTGRARLLNASNGRAFHFGFADGLEFAIVGTDRGRPGLRSTPPPLGLDWFSKRVSGAGGARDADDLSAVIVADYTDAPSDPGTPRTPVRSPQCSPSTTPTRLPILKIGDA